MTEKLNIKLFVGDSQNPEDFSFSQLSTKTGGIFPVASNDLFFSSVQNIPFYTDSTHEERIRILTNSSVFFQNIKASPRVTKPDDIRNTINNNIMTVLFSLFPSFYNSTPNIHNSFDDKIPHSGVAKINAPVLKKNRKVSTIKDNIVYYKGNTVVQITWKNDVFNIPEFQQLFSSIYSFYVWSKTEGMQKIKSGLQKIVENLIDPKNGISNTLEKNIKGLPDAAGSSSSRTITSTPISKETIDEILKIINELKNNYDSLKKNFDNRKNELNDEKNAKTPIAKTEETKKIYEENQQVIVDKIIERINELKYYDNTYNQNSSYTSPVGSIIKGTIENFNSLLANRSLYDVFEKNEYVFKTDDPLPKIQQVLFDNLSRYPKYTEMTEAINKFRSIVIKTSNPDLDRLCNDFFNNTNRNLLYFILHIHKNFLYSTRGKTVLENSFKNIQDDIAEQGRNSSNLYYVGGITQRANNTLLIYVGMDLIRGKVTEINEEKLKKCLFGNERLGNLFTELTEVSNRAVIKNYFYDVIPTELPSLSIQTQKNTSQLQPQLQQVERKGGKTRKKNTRRKNKKLFFKNGVKKTKKLCFYNVQ